VQTIFKPEQKIGQPLRVLIVEDAKSDIALLLLALRWLGWVSKKMTELVHAERGEEGGDCSDGRAPA
jgi:hypothetical protein